MLSGVLGILYTIIKSQFIPLKFSIGFDPDIVVEKSPFFGFRRFRSLGSRGHRIWFRGITTETVKLIVSVPKESNTFVSSVEMNYSYGWGQSVDVGEKKEFISFSTGLTQRLARSINSSEQPNQPFARVDGADLNVWMLNAVCDVRLTTVSLLETSIT